MSSRSRGVVVLVVQVAVVLSIVAKYAWERYTCPAVWTRVTQYDPEMVLRGRYMALSLHADACALPRAAHEDRDDIASATPMRLTGWSWEVLPAVKDGRLTPVLAAAQQPGSTQTLRLWPGLPCEYATISEPTEFFVAEHAKTPFPLAKGQELWAEVTVPPAGPPRPIRLAVSDGREFHVLNLR